MIRKYAVFSGKISFSNGRQNFKAKFQGQILMLEFRRLNLTPKFHSKFHIKI